MEVIHKILQHKDTGTLFSILVCLAIVSINVHLLLKAHHFSNLVIIFFLKIWLLSEAFLADFQELNHFKDESLHVFLTQHRLI